MLFAFYLLSMYTYNYDLSGNITQIYDKCVDTETQKAAKESAAHMEYDSVNRLMKYNGKEVKYDADGNMIYGPLNGEMATFTYDCRNRLIEAKTDSGEATKYAYDAENVRIKVIKNAGTQKESIATYVTDSVSDDLSRVLQAETVDKNGTTETTLYTYGKGLIAQEKGAEYLLYHFDHLGSTTAVTDVGGEIKYTYAYNIFGKLLSGNYGEVEFLYNGQYGVTSDANGLYYMRARYYNIDIMRFINQDILTGSIDSSQSLNRYAYVEGNPVNFLDPFGLCPSEDNNDDLHDFYEGVGELSLIVGAVATIVAIFATGGLAAAAASAAGIASGVGFGSLLVDHHYYWEDYKNSTTREAKKAAMNDIQDHNKKIVIDIVFKGIGLKTATKVELDRTKNICDLILMAMQELISRNI